MADRWRQFESRVDRGGIEESLHFQAFTGSLDGPGAESGAVDEKLRAVVLAWPTLPEPTRLAIYDLVTPAVQ